MKLDTLFYEEVISPILNRIQEKADSPAFFIDDAFYTYRDFGRSISGIRKALSGIASCEDKIGLVINNDIQTYASIFALWMEGKCYVPLHPNWPLERCQDIVGQVGLRHVVDSSSVSRYAGISVIMTGNSAPGDDIPDCVNARLQGVPCRERSLGWYQF